MVQSVVWSSATTSSKCSLVCVKFAVRFAYFRPTRMRYFYGACVSDTPGSRMHAHVDTMKQEGSSLEQLRQERDEARSEAEALKKQVSKLNYRVHHLKQHVQVSVESTL